jgi:hypothetical protein
MRIAPKLRSLVVPAVLVISPYLLLDLSISRYGALLIPLGSVLLIHVAFGKPSKVIIASAATDEKHTNKKTEF